jgi:hypothetical protein
LIVLLSGTPYLWAAFKNFSMFSICNCKINISILIHFILYFYSLELIWYIMVIILEQRTAYS